MNTKIKLFRDFIGTVTKEETFYNYADNRNELVKTEQTVVIKTLKGLIRYISRNEYEFSDMIETEFDIENHYYNIVKHFEYNNRSIEELEITDDVYEEIKEIMMDY